MYQVRSYRGEVNMTNETIQTALWALRIQYDEVFEQRQKFSHLVAPAVFDISLTKISRAIDELAKEIVV
jgi:hypothetical protein